MLNWILWNPSREVFYLPLIHHPITWYGVILALGCGIGYRILGALYQQYLVIVAAQRINSTKYSIPVQVQEFCETLSIYCLSGILLGARLGHILFYENIREYLLHPLRIFMIWEGGISSHGVIVGMAVSIMCYLYRSHQTHTVSFAQIADLLVIPLTLGMAFVRLGNFINQEGVGTYTSLPWGVIFQNPLAVTGGIPRHPVQIYEAVVYAALFSCLYKLYRKHISLLSPGRITAFFLSIGFTVRFFLEYLKEETFYYFHLTMGQWLSIPFILIGGLWLIRCKNFRVIKE